MVFTTTRTQSYGEAQYKWELPLLILIVVLALGIRLTVAVLTTSWIFSSDKNFWQFGFEMGAIAESLARGEGFNWPKESFRSYPGQPTAWMSPVYPVIIAAAFKGLGIYSGQAAIALELFQTLISALTCVVLYILGKRLYNAQTGLIAAFLFAIYPYSIHFAVQKIWSTSLFAFCVLLVICMFLRLADCPRVKSGISLGILLAFTVLVDPVIIGVYPFAFVWLYLKAEGSRRTVTRMIATAMLAFFLGISPWMVRNSLVFGRFVFIKSNFGNELYLGNREGTTGSYKDYRDANWETDLSAVEQEYLGQSDEVTRNSFLLHKAVTFIVKEPVSFVKRAMNRFVRYWTYIKPVRSQVDKMGQAIYLTMLTLAVVGLALSNVKRIDVQLILLFLLLLPVPYYLTHISFYRYRFPTDSILPIFSGYIIYRIASQLRKEFALPSQVQKQQKPL